MNRSVLCAGILALYACGPSEAEVAAIRAELAAARAALKACTAELSEVKDVAYAVSQEPCFQACARQRASEIIRRNENEARAKDGLPPR